MSYSQLGGRLLGQGVYGCTFEPAPRCAGGDVFRRVGGLPAVGKVTVEDATEELGVGRAIMKLPLAAQYFAVPTETCRPEEPVADPDVRACRVISKAGIGSRLTLLAMPAAGTALGKWSMNLPRLAENYERIFVHLLEGMVIYQRAGFIHNDIHHGNILVDEAGVARYIDFGLAFRPDEVRSWPDLNMSRRFSPKHVWQAPEMHAWRMYQNGVRLVDGLDVLRRMNPEYGRLENQFPGRLSALDAMTQFLALPAVGRNDVSAYARQFGTRVDSWRIGLAMWFLWDDLLHWSELRTTRLWNRRDVIRQVLRGLTEFSPMARLSAAAALNLLDPGNRIAGADAGAA